jgi:hypothetical protein
LQQLIEQKAAEAKACATRQILRDKHAAENSKTSKAESALKFQEDQSKVEQIIQEAKRVAVVARQGMEQKRGEIVEEKVASIRNAFHSDSKTGRKIVCGFSGKMQRLPSTIEQFESSLVLYASSPTALSPSPSVPSSSAHFSQNHSSSSSQQGTPHSTRSFMHPKLWSSVVSACSSPENSRPSTSQSLITTQSKSPTIFPVSPTQGFSANVVQSKPRSPSLVKNAALNHISLFPGINANSAPTHSK